MSELRLDKLILDAIQAGESTYGIAKRLKVGYTRITALRYGSALNHFRGRPRTAIVDEVSTFVETNLLADARISDFKMAGIVNKEFGTHYDRTAICRMRNKLGFKWRPPFHIQRLSTVQIQQRIEFCRDMLSKLDQAERTGTPLNIVFSDESRFCLGPDNMWVRVRPGQWNDTATIQLTKYPLGVMVWGCIGIGIKPDLVTMSHHVNAAEYQAAVLGSQLEAKANAKYGVNKWFFMQDGASMHTSMPTIEAIGPYMNILPGWPPNSPDLNPIEMLWAIIGRRLAGKDFGTTAELDAEVKRIWAELAQDTIDRLVQSFRSRLELCLACNGASISQLLSSHRTEPRPQDIAEVTGFPEFSDEVDFQIRDWVENHGRTWTKLHAELLTNLGLGDFPTTVLKNRWQQLQIEDRNAEFTCYRSAGLIFGRPEVIAVYDHRDEPTDEAAEGAVQEDEADEAEAAARRPPAPIVPAPPPRPGQPFLIFQQEIRSDIKAQNPSAKPTEIAKLIGQRWKELSAKKRARYEALAAPSASKRGKGATGRPKKK